MLISKSLSLLKDKIFLEIFQYILANLEKVQVVEYSTFSGLQDYDESKINFCLNLLIVFYMYVSFLQSRDNAHMKIESRYHILTNSVRFQHMVYEMPVCVCVCVCVFHNVPFYSGRMFNVNTQNEKKNQTKNKFTGSYFQCVLQENLQLLLLQLKAGRNCKVKKNHLRVEGKIPGDAATFKNGFEICCYY